MKLLMLSLPQMEVMLLEEGYTVSKIEHVLKYIQEMGFYVEEEPRPPVPVGLPTTYRVGARTGDEIQYRAIIGEVV